MTSLADPLAQVDFADIGGRCFRHDDMVLDARGPWWTLSCPAPADDDDDSTGWLSRPGLWKPVDAAGTTQALDLPAQALGLERSDHGELATLLAWVGATRGGPVKFAEDASAQPRAVKPQELTARVGPFTCQGEVIFEGGRLYVDFPLPTPPQSLSAAGQHWLLATLAAARRLRMVRVDVAPDTRSIHARVDLTGSPPVWRGALLTHGIACLRSAVERLLPSITFLASESVTCRAVELGVELGSLAPTTTKEKEKE
jgi:hypothetical protein